MRIAFVIHDLNNFGGQERSTLEIVSRFAQNHEVHVFASSFAAIPEGIHCHRVPVLVRRPLFLKDFFFRIFVFFQLLFRKFDLVHATGSCSLSADIITVQYCQWRWSIERKHLAKSFSARQLLAEFQLQYDLWSERLIFYFLRNKSFITLSPEVRDDLKLNFGIQDVTVIPHGVNAVEFSPNPSERIKTRKELAFADNEFVLLFVGTFERKGLFFLLPAFFRLMTEYNLKLCVVGSGAIEKATALVTKNSASQRVVFTGHSKEVSKYYQAADAFILPSLYDPFGLVGIEALSSGLPSIVSVQSGVSHLIKEGENGYLLLRPHSCDEIYEKLRLLLENRKNLSAMQKQALAAIKSQTWEQIFPSYEAIFRTKGGS